MFQNIDAGQNRHFPVEKNHIIGRAVAQRLFDHFARLFSICRGVDQRDIAPADGRGDQLAYRKMVFGNKNAQILRGVSHSKFLRKRCL